MHSSLERSFSVSTAMCCRVSESYKLVILLYQHLSIMLFYISLLLIYDLKELVEAFDLPNRDLLKVYISRITKNLGEEMLSF
jgi:hypothetical protein